MRSPKGHLEVAAAACCVALAAFCLGAGPATAATNVYPAGGGTFSGGAQGWEVTDASCNVPALCTASGGYDGVNGNPPGSLAANTTIGVNLLTLFKSTVTLQSPDFTAATAGDATLHLDRQFVSGSLVDQAPQSTYVVTLIDRTAGTKSEVLTETIPAASEFIGKDHAATVKAGHTYALAITTETSSTVAGTGLGGGTTSTRFDNVSLSVQTSGGSGGGAGSGGTLTNQQLQSLIGGSLIGPAVLKGNKITVKARCPAKVGMTCRITVRGMLSRKKAATSSRKAKVAKGKTKKFVLRVKPKALKKVSKSKKLLFKETVRAGKAHATVYRRLKLIRR
ncbi:MAG: collagen-like protein [Solirubrobacterales bacterium]|nr:collagen-like protein [Solirubrobacterales bacterium]